MPPKGARGKAQALADGATAAATVAAVGTVSGTVGKTAEPLSRKKASNLNGKTNKGESCARGNSTGMVSPAKCTIPQIFSQGKGGKSGKTGIQGVPNPQTDKLLGTLSVEAVVGSPGHHEGEFRCSADFSV